MSLIAAHVPLVSCLQFSKTDFQYVCFEIFILLFRIMLYVRRFVFSVMNSIESDEVCLSLLYNLSLNAFE